MSQKTRKNLLSRNFLGKRGFEDWGEFIERSWVALVCRVIGHARPQRVMDGGSICSRCRTVLPR